MLTRKRSSTPAATDQMQSISLSYVSRMGLAFNAQSRLCSCVLTLTVTLALDVNEYFHLSHFLALSVHVIRIKWNQNVKRRCIPAPSPP